MTSLTRAYLAEKTGEGWSQPMRRWTDAFAPVPQPTTLIEKTPVHDKLKRDVYEAEVEKARQEPEERPSVAMVIPPTWQPASREVAVAPTGARSHRRRRRWWRKR